MTQQQPKAAGLSPSHISQAFIEACEAEVRALKPGNVHVFAGGHGMQVADFETSARVAAPFIANAKLGLGERVLRSVEATFAAVHCNTNLGILLLCAPIAAAAQHDARSAADLHNQLGKVLSQLDSRDTTFVFQAIAAANPGGMGDDTQADVRHAPPPGMTLMKAMHLARSRDLIAHEYVAGFQRVFDWHNQEFAPRLAQGWSTEDAIARVYLHALARVPDSHVARKYGSATAEATRRKAAAFETQYFASPSCRPTDAATQRQLLEFDAELKGQGINPGSLADMMAAILFVSGLCQDQGSPASIITTH